MITQRELDVLWEETQGAFDEIEEEFMKEFLGERANYGKKATDVFTRQGRAGGRAAPGTGGDAYGTEGSGGPLT